MSKVTANRVALVAAFLVSLAAGIAGVAKTVPGKTGETILTAAGMLGAVGTSITFAIGSMKFDATPVGQAVHAQRLGVTVPALGLTDVRHKTASAPTRRPVRLAEDPSLQAFGPGNEPAEVEELNPETWADARVPEPADETPA
jgi:TM2 domain-containing membrane protein YozV